MYIYSSTVLLLYIEGHFVSHALLIRYFYLTTIHASSQRQKSPSYVSIIVIEKPLVQALSTPFNKRARFSTKGLNIYIPYI